MEFEDALAELAAKVRDYAGQLMTEEATKTAIVMPFIGRVLGYDVFNPAEVIPEYVCDIGTKRGEKIDYAIVRDGDVQMLIEAKKVGDPLNIDHADQLFRYFHASSARIGVLTNGQVWHFFTDLDAPNKMDERPFLRLDLAEPDTFALPELRKLAKEAFDLDSVLETAEELKYVSAMKREIASQFADPDEQFVRLFAGRVYDGSLTAKKREFFRAILDKALKQFIKERVDARLNTALNDVEIRATDETGGVADVVTVEPVESPPMPPNRLIDTTDDELEGFRVIRAIAASEVPFDRVFGRDTQSYFGVLLDDNNRKPIARLHFNGRNKYLGLLDAEKRETRYPLASIESIYEFSDQIREAVRRYQGEAV